MCGDLCCDLRVEHCPRLFLNTFNRKESVCVCVCACVHVRYMCDVVRLTLAVIKIVPPT